MNFNTDGLSVANISLAEEIMMEASPPTSAPTVEYQDDWSESLWMLVTPRVTAWISIFAILCVALEAWKDLQADKQRSVVRSSRIRSSTTTRQNVTIISRIQLFYQLPLFCYSLALALGSLPVPKGEAWAAIGNVGTCSFQGFLLQFGLHGVYGWDCVLSTTYLMMVRYNVANLRLQSFEKYYHVVIWSFASIVAFIPLSKEMYNFNNTICWLESYPDNCEGDDCLRGAGAIVWQNVASYLSMAHLLYSIIVMVSLYCFIRGMEDTKERYTFGHAGSSHAGNTLAGRSSVRTAHTGSVASTATTRRKHSRAVGIQGMLYAGGMIFTMFPTALYILLWNAFGIWSDGFGIFATSMVPLVGYVNFCIFMRGRSVESCHTGYAKMLRRAHAWMFDYELHCECHCLPRYRGAGIGRPSARAQVQSNDYNKSTAPDPPPGADSNSDPELGVHDTRNEASDARSLKTGPISGFTVKVKGKGNNVSKWVSELGESVISAEDDFSSDIEKANTQKVPAADKKPSRPMRILSELIGDGSGNTQNRKAKSPPIRPERLESCALDNSSQNSAGRRPPSKPERHETEVEASDHQESFETLPPLKKGLFPGFTIRVKEKGNQVNKAVSELGASGMWEEEDGSTETDDNNGAAGDQAPSIPMPALSEIPWDDSDSNIGSQCRMNPIPAGQHSHPLEGSLDSNQNQKLAAIPVKPERLESCVLDNSYENSTTRRPPTKPQRHETEIELSDHKDPSQYEKEAAYIMEAVDPAPPPKRGLFSGFMIKIKKKGKGKKSNPQVSELGASGFSQEEESNSEVDRHSPVANTPQKSQHLGDDGDNKWSQGKSTQSNPVRPERLESCTLDNSYDNSVTQRTPTKPERCESEIETSDHQERERRVSGAPLRPRRRISDPSLSEPDLLDADTTDAGFTFNDRDFGKAPPTIPETSHHCHTLKMPERYVSELEHSEKNESKTHLDASFSGDS